MTPFVKLVANAKTETSIVDRQSALSLSLFIIELVHFFTTCMILNLLKGFYNFLGFSSALTLLIKPGFPISNCNHAIIIRHRPWLG